MEGPLGTADLPEPGATRELVRDQVDQEVTMVVLNQAPEAALEIAG